MKKPDRLVRKFAILMAVLMAVMAVSAEVTCLFEGATMKVLAPASNAGAHIVLLWDATDKGDDPSAWANSHEIAAAVPAGGAQYAVDLSSLGIKNGTPCRIAVYNRYRLLDKLQMTSTQCYINTGFKDTDVYGVRFGFYGNSGNDNGDGWNYIIGTHEGTTDSKRGFVVGQNNANYGSWFWTYRGYRSDNNNRPTVSNSSINEAAFTNRMFTLNGIVVKSDLAAGSVGVYGVNIFLGRAQYHNSRCHYGWWSHVSFDDADGNKILDYIPAQRVADGKVGFLDRATGRFIGSTGSGNFTSGSVTNESFSAEHLWRTVPLRGVAFPGMYIIVR